MSDLPATQDDVRRSALDAHIKSLLKGNVPATRIHEWLLRSGVHNIPLEYILEIDENISKDERSPLDPLAQLLKLKPGEDIGFDPIFEMVKVLVLQRQRFERAIDPIEGIILDPKIVAFERNAYWFLLKDFIEITNATQPKQVATGANIDSGTLPSRGDMASRLRKRLEDEDGKIVVKEIQRTIELYDDDVHNRSKELDLEATDASYE